MYVRLRFAPYLEINWLRLDEFSPSKWKGWALNIEPHEAAADVKQKCKKHEDVEESIIRNASKPTNTSKSRTTSRLRYSKEELLSLRDSPFSLKTPELSDNLKFLFEKELIKPQGKDDFEGKKPALRKTTITRGFEKTGDKLDSSKKLENFRGTEKLSVTFRNDKLDDLRKTTDMASRLRKEPEICLSPQRKSFNTGCSVQNAKVETNSNTEINNSNNNLNLNKQTLPKDSSIIATGNITRDFRGELKENRNREVTTRRIGSGRIISSDPTSFIRNYPDQRLISKDKPQVVYKCTFQKSVDRDNHDSRDRDSIWDRPKNVVHYERRKFPEQNFDDDNNKNHHHRHWDQQRTNNFFERRRPYQSDYYHREDDEEKEPEWMREGPDSKHDFIELRGFDDNILKSFKRNGNPRTTHSEVSNTSKENTVNKESPSKINSELDITTTASSVTEQRKSEDTVNPSEETNSTNKNDIKVAEAPSIEINLEEIFKSTLPDIISESKSVDASVSRFTRWFKQPETSDQNDENKPIPSEDQASATHFNHEANTSFGNETDSAQRQNEGFVASSRLMDMLRANENKVLQKVETNGGAAEPTGKLHSLEEIEAKLRGTDSAKQGIHSSGLDRKKKEEESEAFRKLLCQAFKTNPGSNSVQKLLESNINMNDLAENMRNDNQARKTGPQPGGFCNGDSFMNMPNLMQQAAHLSKLQSMSNSPQFHHQMQLQQQPQPHHPQLQQHPFHHQQQLTSADVMRLFQQQQQQTRSQQEVFSRMLTSSGGNYNSPTPTNASAFGRPPHVPSVDGPYAHVSQEIQMWVNNYNITMEVLKQQETKHLIQRIKQRELTAFQLIEQLKKTPPYQSKFRESALCTLKYLQTHESVLAACPPITMSFAVPPPQSTPPAAASALPHAPQTAPYGENVIQQMMMNQQYRNTPIPDIVYQRDFNVHNQNLFQNNLGSVGSKFSSPQMPGVNQTPLRMNSSLMMNSTNNGSLNLTNSTNTVRDEKVGLSPMSNLNSSPGTVVPKSLSSFTPTSVLLKLSAEKENQDHSVTKDNSEPVKTSPMNNQNTPMRSTFLNGMPSGEGALNRLFLSDVASQPRSSNNPLQNMMSVEEIERVQQSVRN